MSDLLALDFMRQALLAALLAGFAAPLVGVFLVQRRMSLIGDGMGHVALAGVAIGVLTGQEPVFTALIAAVLAAIAIELIRASGRTSGDTALAVMFYGGIALGVVLISRSSSGTPANLTGYLFGAILTTSRSDIVVFAVLAVVVLGTTLVLRQRFFAVANDEEYARAAGIHVLRYNLVLAVLTAVTVVVSMRVVGLLLISALMILPNATSQLFARSFRSGLWWAVLIGVLSSVGGVLVSYVAETPSGGTIVLLGRRRVRRGERGDGRGVPGAPGRARPGRAPRPRTRAGLRPPRRRPRRPRGLPARRSPARRARGPLRRARAPRGSRGPSRGGAAMTDQMQTERRPTRQRAAIAEALTGSREFRSAQDIHAAMAGSGTKVGLATVYRNLQAMAADGEVDVIRTPEGECVYRACATEQHHHHVVCRSCGLAVDVTGDAVERWAEAVAAAHGFTQVQAHRRDGRPVPRLFGGYAVGPGASTAPP